MNSSPRKAARKRASAPETSSATTTPIAAKIPFAKRLPDMSDQKLTAYQGAANRISRDAEHPKHATAIRSIPLIEAEIRRRADSLGDAPPRDAGA